MSESLVISVRPLIYGNRCYPSIKARREIVCYHRIPILARTVIYAQGRVGIAYSIGGFTCARIACLHQRLYSVMYIMYSSISYTHPRNWHVLVTLI